jgi:hypothetical protein
MVPKNIVTMIILFMLNLSINNNQHIGSSAIIASPTQKIQEGSNQVHMATLWKQRKLDKKKALQLYII